MREVDDSELVAAIARGDQQAFSALYERHLPIVLRWCLRETGNRELAADLSAEVFAASLIAARRFQGEGGDAYAQLPRVFNTSALHRDPGDTSEFSCGGALGSRYDHDLAAGKRLTFRVDTDYGPCYGVAHAYVEFVVDTGASGQDVLMRIRPR